jgi:hypothetical protein
LVPGFAVRVTAVPESKSAAQVPGQLMPAGELTTVPVPDAGAVIVNEYDVPEVDDGRSPTHPVNEANDRTRKQTQLSREKCFIRSHISWGKNANFDDIQSVSGWREILF